MAKRITECKERWCCEPDDLIIDPKYCEGILPSDHGFKVGTPVNPSKHRVCKHCGQLFEYYSYIDAAGSRDWDYRPVKS